MGALTSHRADERRAAAASGRRVPVIGPDATALGQVYWYTVEAEGFDSRRVALHSGLVSSATN
jgi:hypothetical protein